MAARSGGLVAVSTLHAVMHGNSKDLTPDTVTGLSRILGISEGRVLALLRSAKQPTEEQASEEKERIWGMYSDIPRQCQKDVIDLLTVLQRNHSVSARRQRHQERREAAHANVVMDEHPVEMVEVPDWGPLNEFDETPAQRERRLARRAAEDKTQPSPPKRKRA